MARSLVPTVNFTDNTQHSAILYGTLAIAGTGNYVAGGIPIDFTAIAPSDMGPIEVKVYSSQPAGSQNTSQYQYQYVPTSNTVPALSGGFVQIMVSAGFTPAGTNSAPTISMAGGGGGGAVTVSPEATGGALVHNAAGTITGVTGVQAPTFTGTAVAAAPLAELSGALPSGVTNDTIAFKAVFYFRNI